MWSEWIDVPVEDDLSDQSEGRYASGIVHFGTVQRKLEVSSSTAKGVKAMMFPPHQPQRRIVSQSLAVGSVLARSREDWRCPEGEGSQWSPGYTTVTHAVVHHTAGSNSVANWEDEVRNIWQFHTFGNGWGDIGYNFLIDPNGVVYEGRAGGLGAIGAHFSCRNTNTVGVALLGTFTSGLPTAAALDSLRKLLAELTLRQRIDPTGFALHVPSQLNTPTIIGHRDGNPSPLTCTRTECPGEAFYATLPALRTDVAATRVTPQPRKRGVRN